MTEAAGGIGWQNYRLRDVVTKLVDGSHNPPPKQDQGRPMLSARNVDQGRINFDEFRYISNKSFTSEHARTRVAPGDVLLTIVGTIGRSAVVPEAIEPFALQRSVAVLSPKDGLLSKFLAYQFQSPRIQRYFEQHARGTAQKGVYLKTLGETPILVPPVVEQRAVVTELEKQFSRLDEAIANLKSVKAKIKRYKTAVLKAAVEGSMEFGYLPRTNWSPSSLLQAALAERRLRWKGRGGYREPAAGEPFSAFPLPESWTSAAIEQLAWSVEYGSSAKTSEAIGGVPVLRMGNIVEGEIDYSELKYLPTDHDEFPRLLLEPGDLLFNRTNSPELVGKTAVFRGNCRCSFASYLIRVRTVSGCMPEFVAAYINSPYGRSWVKSVVTQQVGQANVNSTKLQALVIPLPPLEVQQRIVAEVDRRLSIIREVETELDANLRRAQSLRQVILAEAFRGES